MSARERVGELPWTISARRKRGRLCVAAATGGMVAALSLPFQFALALLYEFAPSAFEFLVLQALRDTFLGATFRDLHLGLHARLYFVYRGGFARLLLRRHLVRVN
jgi:hypothetical protein